MFSSINSLTSPAGISVWFLPRGFTRRQTRPLRLRLVVSLATGGRRQRGVRTKTPGVAQRAAQGEAQGLRRGGALEAQGGWRRGGASLLMQGVAQGVAQV